MDIKKLNLFNNYLEIDTDFDSVKDFISFTDEKKFDKRVIVGENRNYECYGKFHEDGKFKFEVDKYMHKNHYVWSNYHGKMEIENGKLKLKGKINGYILSKLCTIILMIFIFYVIYLDILSIQELNPTNFIELVQVILLKLYENMIIIVFVFLIFWNTKKVVFRAKYDARKFIREFEIKKGTKSFQEDHEFEHRWYYINRKIEVDTFFETIDECTKALSGGIYRKKVDLKSDNKSKLSGKFHEDGRFNLKIKKGIFLVSKLKGYMRIENGRVRIKGELKPTLIRKIILIYFLIKGTFAAIGIINKMSMLCVFPYKEQPVYLDEFFTIYFITIGIAMILYFRAKNLIKVTKVPVDSYFKHYEKLQPVSKTQEAQSVSKTQEAQLDSKIQELEPARKPLDKLEQVLLEMKAK